jgi:hypothetical protein
MSTEMLDRLQENKLRGLEELIDSWEAAATTSGVEDEAAAIADFFVDEGLAVRQRSLSFWDHVWRLALAGKVPNRRERGVKLRSLLERSHRILGRSLAAARHYAGLSGRQVARLSELEEQARAFPLWVEECLARWAMLDRPRKPLDPERIARSQAAYARGEREAVSDVIARLEQGGPLVKE